ncbi:MAG: tRNA lysidine(34) synthetase TilS, partial [Xanthomonadales bacterium]|nr:tRNA lysidine(34) synthetase TilS [Xanthomonadales bacterium]
HPDGIAPLDPRELLARLQALGPARRWWVALSGGTDSTALLHACTSLRDALDAPLAAVHVNHGLYPDADAWQARVVSLCERLDVPLECQRVHVDRGAGGGPEARARDARYAAFEGLLDKDEVLLLAHHADDQAETVLLHLLRGSGVDGLAGMPETRPLGAGRLARPLLGVRRAALEAYLRVHEMGWIEDPANDDRRMDRNWLRGELLPLLEARFPGAAARLARSARHCREASDALDALAGDVLPGSTQPPVLDLERLKEARLPAALVLRTWLRRAHAPPIPEARLDEFLRQLAEAGPGKPLQVHWSGWQLGRHRDALWLHPAQPACPERQSERWEAGPPRAGERILVAGRGHRVISRLLQDRGVPPWLRPAVPVLRHDGHALAVGGAVFDPEHAERVGQAPASLAWRPDSAALREVRRRLQARG